MFKVKTQLSVVIANRPGILSKICDMLGSHKINIEGLSAYGEREHGIIRLVTSDPERSAELLSNSGFLVTRTSILSVKLTNRPAGLARLARQLAAHRINIDYSYGSSAAAGRMATIYLRVANPDRASMLLNSTPPATEPRPKSKATPAEDETKKKTPASRAKPARDRHTVRARRGRR